METQHHGSMDECVEHLVRDHYPHVFPDVNAKTAPITISTEGGFSTVPTTEQDHNNTKCVSEGEAWVGFPQ